MNNSINVTTRDGSFHAFMARPQVQPAATIVVLHEIFGINADMRDRCIELADEGYIAICPDLFWRQERGVDLSDQTESEWKKGFALYNAFDLSTGISDIAATLDAGRSLEGATGKIGVTGYCLGGLLTFLAAARLGADAAAVYYPGGAENHLAEVEKLTTPMLLHLAEEDEYIPRAAQLRIIAALEGRPNVKVNSYPGCSHAFARHRGIHFDAGAATLADARTAAFFNHYLKC